MSRSKRRSPIMAVTTAVSEALEKAKWHRCHRREERARLRVSGTEYVARSHREHSDPWTMEKDGKKYWAELPERYMRK